jgi:NAD(P)-dependent dehydrogenase (short-subunit alcohol dehydrogenase family)
MGGAIVRELTRTHDVIAVGRSADALSELAAQTGATPWALDITDADALAARTAELTRLDVLVHGAAIAAVHSTETATPEDWERQFAINVFAPAELTRQVLPLLRESGDRRVHRVGSRDPSRSRPRHLYGIQARASRLCRRAAHR